MPITDLPERAAASEPMFSWTDWEAETDLDNPDDREGVYFLTIWAGGDEWAVLIHRVCDGAYPLDGHDACEKQARAQFIVDALNCSEPAAEHIPGRPVTVMPHRPAAS